MASNENMYNEYFRYFNKMNELYNGYIKGIERTNQLYTKSIKNVDLIGLGVVGPAKAINSLVGSLPMLR